MSSTWTAKGRSIRWDRTRRASLSPASRVTFLPNHPRRRARIASRRAPSPISQSLTKSLPISNGTLSGGRRQRKRSRSAAGRPEHPMPPAASASRAPANESGRLPHMTMEEFPTRHSHGRGLLGRQQCGEASARLSRRVHRPSRGAPSPETKSLQAKFAELLRRQRHVRDLVLRFCHQHLKGDPHGRTGYALRGTGRIVGVTIMAPPGRSDDRYTRQIGGIIRAA